MKKPKFRRGQKVWYYPLGKRRPKYKRIVEIVEVKKIELPKGGVDFGYRIQDEESPIPEVFPTFHFESSFRKVKNGEQ